MRAFSLTIINIGVVLFIINWISDREFDWKAYYISEYVHSKNGTLSIIAFIFIGVGSILSTNIFYYKVSFIEYILFIYGILFALLGIFPVDKRGKKLTWRGILHTVIAHLCFNSFAVSFLLKAVIDNSHTPYIVIVVVINFLSAALILLLPNRYKGLLQRIIILSQIFLIEILLINGKLLGKGL